MIKAVPTNIITGFLGVGKTSTLLHLLKQKPASERWALLINEFGEVGVDGSIVAGSAQSTAHAETQQVFIKEVPGGCMCCAAGLPMHVALNQLLAISKPHRLLIEPTGLGHPVEVLQTLSAPHYRDILEINKTLTLVDARKLSDERYTNHPTFNQQIDIADVIIGNKQDLYEENDVEALAQYVEGRGKPDTPISFANHGSIDFNLLYGKSEIVERINNPDEHDHSHKHEHEHDHSNEHKHNHDNASMEQPIPSSGFLKSENTGEGFHAVGWRFSPDVVFKREALLSWISTLSVERLKAVVITSDGILSFNLADGELSQRELNECLETRIEVIATDNNPKWDKQLNQCINADCQE